VFGELGDERWAKSETGTWRSSTPPQRVYVPARAEFNVEHEREGDEEEIEFQLKWTNS
jgi:hypothetical protein